MNINRNNYEEYFLLYVDNELNAVEREAVEVFVMQNADLRGELNMLQQTVLRADKKVSFINKAELMKSSAPANPVNETNYEEYFILYGDDELSNEEKDFVEQFVYRHPQHQLTFELLQGIRFTADTSVVFPDKQSLYRTEKDERVIVMRWWRIAAAAIVILFMGGAAFYFSGNTNDPGELAKGKTQIDTPAGKNNNSPNLIVDDKNLAASTEQTKNITEDAVSSEQKGKNQQQPVLVKNTPVQKNNEQDSNFPKDPIVTHIEGIAKVDEPKIETGIAISAVTPPQSQVIDGPVNVGLDDLDGNDAGDKGATFASNDDQIEVLNTTVSNKNKMRGFLRKVGRVVDKATNIGPTDEREDKKGIRIASFQIALK